MHIQDQVNKDEYYKTNNIYPKYYLYLNNTYPK